MLRHKKSFTLKQIFRWLCILFIACLPIFAGKILFDDQSWYQGKYVNYFQIRLSLHMILSLAVIIVNFYVLFQHKKYKVILLSCGTILGLLIYNAIVLQEQHILSRSMVLASTWNLLEFLVFWLAFGIVLRKIIIGSFAKKYLFLAILFSLLLQLILGIFQVILRTPLLTQILTPFGQPPVFESFTYFGTAIFPRMYGTTPHPNILAAIATLFSAIVLFLDSSRLRGILTYFIALAVILGTLSRTGMMAIAFITILFLGRKFFNNQLKHRKIFNNATLLTLFLLAFFFISGVFISILPHETMNLPYFIESRAKLEDAYVRFMIMFPNIWLLGTGFLGTLPLLYQNYTKLSFPMLLENSFFFDIPHHIGTLLHLELGLPVCGLLFWIISRWFVDLRNHGVVKKRDTYSFILSLGILFLIFGVFDHFLVY